MADAVGLGLTYGLPLNGWPPEFVAAYRRAAV